MIRVTRLSDGPLIINSDLIERIATTPDTVIHMTTGQRITVFETVDEVVNRVIDFRQRVFQCPGIRAVTNRGDN